MAKKKKHLIKLNTKVRSLFNGVPFDEGIADVDSKLLEALIFELDIDIELTRSSMIKVLRRVWSEGDYPTRHQIVKFLDVYYHPHRVSKKIKKDIKHKIKEVLQGIEYTKMDEELLIEHFANTPLSSLSHEAIAFEFAHIKDQDRIKKLEKRLGIIVAPTDIEFYAKYNFELFDEVFEKELQSSFEPIDNLLSHSDDEIESIIEEAKERAYKFKAQSIREFIEALLEHPYLSNDEIIEHIKRAPVDSDLYHIPLDIEIFKRLVTTSSQKVEYRFESGYQANQVLVKKDESYELFNKALEFTLETTYTKNFLSGVVWRGEKLPFHADFSSVYEEAVRAFEIWLDDIYAQLQAESSEIEIDEFAIENFILEIIAPIIESRRELKLKEKHKRTILYNFMEYIKPLKERKLREELLAKSIRDFKSLFPLARSLDREVIFHMGPTNSGKTYEAMQALKSATTGYYLAPLRLLALEGYEELRANGVNVSLITGEEEIIDEESTHICSTIEMLNSSVDVDVCVIDEIQMINDRDRGWAWTNALIGAPAKKVYLTGSSDALNAVREICEYLEEKLTVIEFERKNELSLLKHPTDLGSIERGSAIVSFSRRDVLSLKQQLSHKYKISVVYGNLSPEVRREEARRFREGESEILISTDAIAMGLNLPIRTLLFAKDNKFDGLRRRELTPTEVLQISGRAGRYGIEERGFVGALSSSTLSHIGKMFKKPLPSIKPPFAVMASLEHVLLIGEILDNQNLLEILEFFADNMEFEGPFVAANIDSMLEIAQIVDDYELELVSRYHLACAPASISSPYIENKFHYYIKKLEKGEAVEYIPPRKLPNFAMTNEMMLDAEDRVREISLYLWLSFKFPEQFEDTEQAIMARAKLNNFIEESLKRGELTKRCTKCSKPLDFSYKFSICDSCFHKKSRSYRRSRYR
ncbi:MAG: SUV3 C-terminal domain-containing protein [Campylobacterota bacterium]|nr:SUV3 C-terminal domain-containing protein [Campylobacterota bacterium]